jgi:hypothetical protein
VVNATLRPFYPTKETRQLLYRRLCGPQYQSGRVPNFSSPTRIRTPDPQALSESLYRLSYCGPSRKHIHFLILEFFCVRILKGFVKCSLYVHFCALIKRLPKSNCKNCIMRILRSLLFCDVTLRNDSEERKYRVLAGTHDRGTS